MRRLLFCMIGVAAFSACGSPTSQPAGSTGTAAAAAATSTPQSGVPAALAFTAPLVGGGSVDLATYAGKPVVVWFWAPT